ncbi:outer membrane protein assembly factor BamE [Nitrospirillum sp. BR 11163]|uniref:outer membrane protein assembly factor BamE n=1 Tax=Nitrospirillum sp. BR 11163 TaxID=3104323 RepID=UPI002AFE6B33|nr:outer membrane protein assembly factor BamE [Nitrospirillum sp. BR 11163]MEA1676325.1 outer membrane protein assembly factor BamE [Nitrospirillum sp. BR 11163]
MPNKTLKLLSPAGLIGVGLLGIGLTACTPTVNNRGNLVEDRRLADVHPGTSTKEDVQKALGSPSTTSTLDANVWYYIGAITENEAFFDPDIVQQRVLQVSFNDQGVVSAVGDLDLAQQQDISPEGRETPTAGHEVTFLEQLMGNLNREKKKDDKKKKKGGD